MKPQKISDRVYALHADVRTDDLFEGLPRVEHQRLSRHSLATRGFPLGESPPG